MKNRPTPGGQPDLLAWRPRPRRPWRRFDLLTWNLLADVHIRADWYPLVDPQALAPTARHPRLLRHLQGLEADVMALQEVDHSLLSALARAFPDHHLSHAPYGGEGMVVLVRGGPVRAEARPLPGGHKQALLVELPGGWRLATVHLTWAGEPPTTPRRGLDQLRAVLEWQPDLICGDFNSFPTWPERRAAAQRGYLDGTPAGPTCNVGQHLQPLDAVLHRPGWRCEAAPISPISATTPMPSPRHPSDHLPVRVTLVAPGEGRA